MGTSDKISISLKETPQGSFSPAPRHSHKEEVIQRIWPIWHHLPLCFLHTCMITCQEKFSFILDILYMINFNNVNIIMIIYEIRWAEGFYKNALKSTTIFTFLRIIALDQSKIDKKKKNKNEGKISWGSGWSLASNLVEKCCYKV